MWSIPSLPPSPKQPLTAAAKPTAPTAPAPLVDTVSALDAATLPPDVLQIGTQRYSQVRELTSGLTPEHAATLTRGNGIDEIFFTDAATGKNYVAIQENGSFANVRVGYLGRYNGARVEVKAVDDEDNTFNEGVVSTWMWAKNVLSNTFGNEASKSLSTIATTAMGSFVAAAALKETAQATPSLLKDGLSGFLSAMRGAAANFLQTLGSLALTGAAVIGAVSIVNGIRAAGRKSDFTTIDMVTGNF